jgi:hypothetical protein
VEDEVPTVRPTTMWTTILSVAGLLLAASAFAEDQTISIPGEDWKIRFDAPQLTPGKGVAHTVFYGRSHRLQISVFVEPPRCPGGDSDENVYECFAAVLRKNPVADWDTERANTRPNGGVTVMYMTRGEIGGVKGGAFNINLLLVHNGKWVDMHTSIASPTQADIKTLYAIVSSAEIVPNAPDDRPAAQ